MFFPSYSLMLLALLIESFPPLFSLDAYLVAFELFDCCFIFLKREVRAQLGHWRTATIHRSTEHATKVLEYQRSKNTYLNRARLL